MPQRAAAGETVTPPPVYIISLARAAQRREDICRRLNAAGISHEILDAVDGEKEGANRHGGGLRQDLCRRKHGRDMTPGEIGCFLSHRNLWRKIAAQENGCAMVLEDDAVWDGDFLSAAARVMECEWIWDVVLFSRFAAPKIDRALCELGNGRRLVRYKTRALTTAAYLISQSGAQKMLHHCREMREPVDNMMGEWWKNGAAFYSVHPPPVKQADFPSLIGGEKRGAKYSQMTVPQRIAASLARKRERWACRIYLRTNPPKKKTTATPRE